MSTHLTHPLIWMDAVEAERASQAEALPTVEALAQSIEAFHQANGLVITPKEAAGAAVRCLADPAQPVPSLNLPWKRPTTVAQWHEQRATAEADWAVFNQRENWFDQSRMIGMSLVGMLATVGGLTWADGFHWITFLPACVAGVIGGLLGGIWGMLRNPWETRRIATEQQTRVLGLMDPSDQDLADLEQWLKIPQIATWMARLRQSEVPLLNGDLDELRSRARAHVYALTAQDKRDQFTARLDQGLVDLRAEGELTA